MDEEEWPVDPDAVVVSDEPTEGLVTTPVEADSSTPDVTTTDTAPEAAPPGPAAAAGIDAVADTGGEATSSSADEPVNDATGDTSDDGTSGGATDAAATSDAATAAADLDASETIGEAADGATTGDTAAPATIALPAADAPDPAPAATSAAEAAGPGTTAGREAGGTTAATPARGGDRRTLVAVAVLLVVSLAFGRTLVRQRDDARHAARTANDTVESLRDEIAGLRDTVASATERQDDPFGDVFVERQDDVRADVLDDVLGDQRADLRTCVASQLTDAIAGRLPQVPLDDFDAQVAATATWVEDVRGHEFRSLPRVVRTDAATLAARAEVNTPDPTTSELDDQLWRMLGAIGPDDRVATIVDELRRAAIAGQYDPTTNELWIAVEDPEGPLNPLELVTLAHELEHALVIQHLGRPQPAAVGGGDLAALALVEGDATLTMTRFEIGALDPIALLGSLDDQSFSELEELVADAPHVVADQLRFPYTDGLAFACALERDGGNDAIDAAYGAPPATTAQVMWPERYHAAEAPVDVRDMPSPGERWAEQRRTTMGALELRSLFEAPGDDPAAALDDADTRASAWAGGEVAQWSRGDDTALGLAFAEHADHDGPTLCTSLMDWYRAAFPDEKIEQATDGLVAVGSDHFAVIRCANDTVRLGIGPDAESAAAITR